MPTALPGSAASPLAARLRRYASGVVGEVMPSRAIACHRPACQKARDWAVGNAGNPRKFSKCPFSKAIPRVTQSAGRPPEITANSKTGQGAALRGATLSRAAPPGPGQRVALFALIRLEADLPSMCCDGAVGRDGDGLRHVAMPCRAGGARRAMTDAEYFASANSGICTRTPRESTYPRWRATPRTRDSSRPSRRAREKFAPLE